MKTSNAADQRMMAPASAKPFHADISVGAFGGIAPQADEHAAAKFALSAIGRDRRVASLADLLCEGAPTGGLEGEPGWLLERRDDGDTMPGYAAWPAGAKYRAYVDPEDFSLKHPERYYDRASFHELVRLLLDAYQQRFPEHYSEVAKVRPFL